MSNEESVPSNKPLPQHEHLRAFEGEWDAKVSFYPAPGAEPFVSQGVMKNTMALGGFFLEQRYESHTPQMDPPFMGIGLMGFNPAGNRYEAVWIDSASAGMPYDTGVCSEDGKRFTMKGRLFNPMVGAWMDKTTILTVKSDREHEYEQRFQLDDGSEYRTLHIAFTKRS